MLMADIEPRLQALLSEVRQSIRVNERLLSESASRVVASRRRLAPSFIMRGSSEAKAVPPRDQPTVPRRPVDPVLRERVRQAMDRKQIPACEPDRFLRAVGTGRGCCVCEQPVTTEKTALNLQFTPDDALGRSAYQLHVRCCAAWLRILQDDAAALILSRSRSAPSPAHPSDTSAASASASAI